MSIQQFRVKRKRNVTQICFKLLLHLYDNKIAYNRDTRIWGEDGLRQRVPTAYLTFMEALTILQDKGLVQRYNREHGYANVYAALTQKGQLLMDDKTKLMMILFT